MNTCTYTSGSSICTCIVYDNTCTCTCTGGECLELNK